MFNYSQIFIVRFTIPIFFYWLIQKKPCRQTKFIKILNHILTWLTYYYFHLRTLLSLFIGQWLWDKRNFKFSFNKVKIIIR